jgi:hypothetical protein
MADARCLTQVASPWLPSGGVLRNMPGVLADQRRRARWSRSEAARLGMPSPQSAIKTHPPNCAAYGWAAFSYDVERTRISSLLGSPRTALTFRLLIGVTSLGFFRRGLPGG